MFIAHLPAGYLAGRPLVDRLAASPAERRRLLLWALLWSVLPDVDLIYFYTIGARQHPHHTYWTHLPVFWMVFFSSLLLLERAVCTRALPYLAVAAAAVFLHLGLDTITGGILWLFPASDVAVHLFDVPPRHSWWVLNFLLHWTAVLELGLVLWAALTLAHHARGPDRARLCRPWRLD